MRKLRYHEQKLLKKTNLIVWKSDNKHEGLVMQRYGLSDPNEYDRYNRLATMICKLTNRLAQLPLDNAVRMNVTKQLTDKLYNLGVTNDRKLSVLSRLPASAFCRRRLGVLLIKLHMAETVKVGNTFIKHGHVKVGENVVRDPGFIVSRTMEDHITWSNGSKIREHVKEFRGEKDDLE